MPDPIPPALSPEEWADYTADALSLRDILSSLGDGVGLHDDERVTARDLFPRATPERHHHAAMALHNFALPNDDPRKITREDVAAVEQSLWSQYGDGFTVDCLSYCATCQRELPAGSMTFCRQHHADKLRALAAKLEALLPTEDSTHG